MKKSDEVRHVLWYVLFLLSLISFTFVKIYLDNLIKVGEYLFLVAHQHTLATFTLKLDDSESYYKYFLLGRIYFVEGDSKNSIINYNKAILQNPKIKESYYGRGLAYGFSHQLYWDEAERDFKKYIELEQEEFDASGVRAYGAWAGYNDLAWMFFLQGNFQQAEETARAGLNISTNNPWLSNMLGSILVEQGKCAEGRKYLEQARLEAEELSVEEFGEAYSGDKKSFYEKGLNDMKKTIVYNQRLCGNG
jgi:tetratricopeptide (TPR) repeat protein